MLTCYSTNIYLFLLYLIPKLYPFMIPTGTFRLSCIAVDIKMNHCPYSTANNTEICLTQTHKHLSRQNTYFAVNLSSSEPRQSVVSMTVV